MHAVCGFPAKSTWMEAIRNNHYVGWPLLTVNNVHNHYPETVETPRGHLNQRAAGICSTNPGPEPLPQANPADVKKAFNKKERDVFIKVWDPKDTIYSDQTGKFPVQSRRKNNYIMVMCHVDSDSVLAEPMKNKSAKEMIRAYTELIYRLGQAGHVPKSTSSTTSARRSSRRQSKKHVFCNSCHQAHIGQISPKYQSRRSNSTLSVSSRARQQTSRSPSGTNCSPKRC